MSYDYNHVVLTGRLARDVKEHKSVTKFTLAVGRGKRDGEDQGADFVNVVCFGKTAEFASAYLEKGKAILVEGRVNTGKYENKEGQMVYTTDIVANKVLFLPLNKRDGRDEHFEQKRNGYQKDSNSLDNISEDAGKEEDLSLFGDDDGGPPF